MKLHLAETRVGEGLAKTGDGGGGNACLAGERGNGRMDYFILMRKDVLSQLFLLLWQKGILS